MTIDELISELTDMKEQCGGQTEVRLAHQPQWAFEYSISSIGVANLKNDDICDDNGNVPTYPDEWDDMDAEERQDWVNMKDEREENPDYIVYIGEGSQLGYLPSAGKQAVGW